MSYAVPIVPAGTSVAASMVIVVSFGSAPAGIVNSRTPSEDIT
jgi:hypothetical protein